MSPVDITTTCNGHRRTS